MAKERLVINEYVVPGGSSGVAVRRACETVLANPGITQKDLLEEAVKFSGLNLSTAGWLTSPGNPWNGKSPATRLWERRKEGVFRCYPNEHTDKVVGAEAALFDEIMNQTRRGVDRGVKYRPKVGDLVKLDNSLGKTYAEGLFIGYSFGRMEGFNDPLYNSIEAIIEARPRCTRGDRVYMDIVENGTGRRLKHWFFDLVQPA
jgi:hypothetical protein